MTMTRDNTKIQGQNIKIIIKEIKALIIIITMIIITIIIIIIIINNNNKH